MSYAQARARLRAVRRMKTSRTKGYTSEVRMHTGGGRSQLDGTRPCRQSCEIWKYSIKGRGVPCGPEGHLAASASQAC